MVIYLIKIINKKDRTFYYFKNSKNKPWFVKDLDLAMNVAKQLRTWHPDEHVLVEKEKAYDTIRI